LRLALIHTQPLFAHEAGVAFTSEAADGLGRAGADVTLLVPRGSGDVFERLRHLGVPAPPAFRLQYLPPSEYRLGPLHGTWSARFRRRAIKAVRAGNFDAVIVRDLRLAHALAFAKTKAKIVYELHNVYTLGQDDPQAMKLFPPKKLKMHESRVALEAETLMAVDGAIALTAGLRDMLTPLFGLDGRVAAAGSALHPLDAPTKNERPTDIAYIGSLHPHKGVGVIVEALTMLPPEVRLRLIGHGRHHEPLAQVAAQMGVGERLVLDGWREPAELPAALANCFAAAVPLEDCFYNCYVTSPMKLFDYARAGVVPVVPRLPVFTELFPDARGAVLVHEPSAASFAAALQRLYEDAHYRIGKENELAAFAATHTWAERGKSLLPFFAALTKRTDR